MQIKRFRRANYKSQNYQMSMDDLYLPARGTFPFHLSKPSYKEKGCVRTSGIKTLFAENTWQLEVFWRMLVCAGLLYFPIDNRNRLTWCDSAA